MAVLTAVTSGGSVTRFSSAALAEARLRASPRFHLAAPGRLAPVAADGDPAVSGAGHLVTAETAQLLASLHSARRIEIQRGNVKAIIRLILDDLIEIEIGGRFRSGPDAHAVFFTPAGAGVRRDTIGRLSLAALEYAAALGPIGAARLCDRLYRYNSWPVSPGWRRRLPDGPAVDRFLDPGQPRAGKRRPEPYLQGTWRAWDAESSRTPRSGEPRYKLYLSPEPAHTGRACAALLATLGTRHGPFTMKVGRELSSLLRPDRLVGYFITKDQLFETAARLRATLDGMPAQGVPFTAALGTDGLMSWGADLPVSSLLPAPLHDRSWRGWVTSRLGSALGAALQANLSSPVRFALDRVALDGVNTSTWAPAATLLRFASRLGATSDADR
jgi:hypothetical protein